MGRPNRDGDIQMISGQDWSDRYTLIGLGLALILDSFALYFLLSL